MRKQTELYSVKHMREQVMSLTKANVGFIAVTEQREIRAKAILLATGVVNRRPEMLPDTHDEALKLGLLRYCPICDGYEITDQSVAVVGNTQHAVEEVEFIRSYTENVTLISPDPVKELGESLRIRLSKLGVSFLKGQLTYEIEGDHIVVKSPSWIQKYKALYPAQGSEIRSELGIGLGACISPEGCLTIDTHQATNIEGLYAAGDVVKGLDQIANAIGQGSVAATAIRNFIDSKTSLLRFQQGNAPQDFVL
jgi:thioredoxin reductase (NADPH)